MSDPNPFAPLTELADPPRQYDDDGLGIDLQADVVAESRVFATGKGDQVRTSHGATWPARCIVCNTSVEAATQELHLPWSPRWVFLLALLGGIPWLIVAAFTRERIMVRVALCPDHLADHRRGRARARLVGAAALIVTAAAGLVTGEAGLYLLALLVGATAYALAERATRLLVVHAVDADSAVVIASRPFVASLPRE